MKSVDWRKWAAIAEIVGTFAVVVSLIFVGMSVRQNTAVNQANQRNVLYELTDNWFSDQVSNPELYEIELKAADPQALTPVERRRYSDQVYRSINVWEIAYFNHQNGLLTDDQYQAWHNAMARWIETSLPRWIWNGMREGEFDPEFVLLVDALVEKYQR